MPQVAPGLPDPAEYGQLSDLKAGQLVPFFVQAHDALRAKKHEDWRLGNLKQQLLSWAVPKGTPAPGEKRLAIQQPLHEEAYGPWSGTIESGYGAGKVESKVRGKALVTSVDDDGVTFVTAHTRYPERFRLQQTPKGWILINATKTETRLPYEKVHYQQVEEDAVDKLFTPKNLVTAKIDGSAAFYELLGDKIEALSARTSRITGRPIVHTERIGSPRLREKLKDTVLRGEMYGVRGNQAIPAAELGGLLNSTIEVALARRKERDIEMRHAVFDILKHEGKDVRGLPYGERLKLLRGVLEKLPEQFHLPEGYTDPARQRELWDRIRTGKDPLTREGIVAHPLTAGAVPIKAKTYPENDVIIKAVVPGKGRLKGMASGGFWYALPSDPDKIVGRVGTGLSDEDRWDMWQNPGEWVGRTARIRAQEQFPSGAYRAPAFLARHEDVTQKSALDICDLAKEAADDGHRWGWLAVRLPPALQSKVRRLVARIDRHDLAEGGKEREPHITVAYGLEATDGDKPAIRQELENFKAPAITIGGTSVFDNQGYKVLKLDVDSPELHELRQHIAGKYPMPGNTYPEYHPHITLAYLKPEVDESKYLDNDLAGQKFKGGRWVFRGKREQEKVAMSTATELKRHLQKAAAEEEEELGANAVFRTKWPSDRHPGRFEHLNLGPDVTSGMEATLAVPTTVMGTVTVPRVKIPDYEATRLGWQAARGMAADVAPPLIALAALLGVGGIGGAAYWHHRKNRKRQQDESLRKKQQEKTAMTKSQELKRRLQKAAAEVAQTQEEEAKKRKGPTFGQKLLRGGLATAAGGMAGLIGGGYGGFKLGQHASNRLQDSALRELRADHQASRSGLSSLWMPPLSEENLKAIAGAATENDRAELEGTGALGGAALGAGGGALLGLALYLAFRRTGG
jgi:2'-5' RNA ligase